jgi:ABC-type antimicrobial peptide transport system permease subunit
MVREILPNLVAPIIVYTTLVIQTNILFEAALSFLGVGVQEPDTFVSQNDGRRLLEEAGVEVIHVTGLEKEILEVATAGHVSQ